MQEVNRESENQQHPLHEQLYPEKSTTVRDLDLWAANRTIRHESHGLKVQYMTVMWFRDLLKNSHLNPHSLNLPALVVVDRLVKSVINSITSYGLLNKRVWHRILLRWQCIRRRYNRWLVIAALETKQPHRMCSGNYIIKPPIPFFIKR